MGRLLDLDDFLDPKSLTPQELYKLQSDTWAQGAEYERERIIKLLKQNATGEYKKVMLTPKLISEIKGEQK